LPCQKRPALLKAERLSRTRVRVELVVRIMPLFENSIK
jgi:hypothetical protein